VFDLTLETLKLSRAVITAPGFAVIVLGTLKTLDVNTDISMPGSEAQ
jgi:hypothetical protein